MGGEGEEAEEEEEEEEENKTKNNFQLSFAVVLRQNGRLCSRLPQCLNIMSVHRSVILLHFGLIPLAKGFNW